MSIRTRRPRPQKRKQSLANIFQGLLTPFMILLVCAAGYIFTESDSEKLSTYAEKAGIIDPKSSRAETKIKKRLVNGTIFVTKSEIDEISKQVNHNFMSKNQRDVTLNDGTRIPVQYHYKGTCPKTGNPIGGAQITQRIAVIR